MASPDAWPIPLISKTELYYFLKDLLVVDALELVPLKTVQHRPDNWDATELHDRVLQALALPASRIELAGATGFSYKQITDWVIRTDLVKMFYRVIRSEELKEPNGIIPDNTKKEAATIARLLARDGLIGVHHFADSTNDWKPSSVKWVTLIAAGANRELFDLIRNNVEQQAKTYPSEIVATTQAVLIVKGAGAQQQDASLNIFLKGFWPALVAADPNATLVERPALKLPPTNKPVLKEDKKGRIAEIRTGERRLWIKEAYWESGISPPGALPALLLEWRMATYVLVRVIWELISDPESKKRSSAIEDGDPLRYGWSFFWSHFLILLPVAIAFWQGPFEGLSDLLKPHEVLFASSVSVLVVALVAFLMSIPAASETNQILKGKRKQRFSLPGIAGLLMLVLMADFVLHPLRYLLYLTAFVLVQACLISARMVAWRYRSQRESDINLGESDTNLTEWGVGGKERKYGGGPLARFTMSPWLYRYIVVLTLPLIALLLGIARLLMLIPGIRNFGVWLENFANSTLSGTLGDVVVYATEPGESAWIRNAIITDLRVFHERVDVDQIHVFAHSQGTPITFETLFYHLPGMLRSKIKTYITIGSVLNYFHQANWVFDLLYVQRFPRIPYPVFADGFQWVNFWNYTDPVPEFAALDHYADYSLTTSENTKPHPASPLNIKTRWLWNPLESHGEYWTNIEEVHAPFVQRLLQGTALTSRAQRPQPLTTQTHASYVFGQWMWRAIPVVGIYLLGVVLLLREGSPLPPLLDRIKVWMLQLPVIAPSLQWWDGLTNKATIEVQVGIVLTLGVFFLVWVPQFIRSIRPYPNEPEEPPSAFINEKQDDSVVSV